MAITRRRNTFLFASIFFCYSCTRSKQERGSSSQHYTDKADRSLFSSCSPLQCTIFYSDIKTGAANLQQELYGIYISKTSSSFLPFTILLYRTVLAAVGWAAGRRQFLFRYIFILPICFQYLQVSSSSTPIQTYNSVYQIICIEWMANPFFFHQYTQNTPTNHRRTITQKMGENTKTKKKKERRRRSHY